MELAAHETIAVARVNQTDEMNGEHGHVESQRDYDQAENPREQVFKPDAHGDIFGVADEDPELQSRERAHPRNGEEADPFYAGRGAEAYTRGHQPKPPARGKGALRSLFVLVRE